MELYTLENIKDKYIGKKGSPKRDKYETDLNAFLMGEAIKEARLKKQLTQQQLSERSGIGRTAISRVENGKDCSLSTISRICRAIGIKTEIGLSGIGRFAL
jgi:DNA-binding XRE family transcriptional regulator